LKKGNPLRHSVSGNSKGTQFKYSRNKDGAFSKTGNDAMPTGEFIGLLDRIEEELRRHGRQIFSGCARAYPYRKGNERACAVCACQTVCRFDPWVDAFRVLGKLPEPPGGVSSPPAEESGR
jgi:ATP-dependent helicase/DNAse subunit B